MIRREPVASPTGWHTRVEFEMSAENEVYLEGRRILRALRKLRTDTEQLDASDTACKVRAVTCLGQAEAELARALEQLSGIV